MLAQALVVSAVDHRPGLPAFDKATKVYGALRVIFAYVTSITLAGS